MRLLNTLPAGAMRPGVAFSPPLPMLATQRMAAPQMQMELVDTILPGTDMLLAFSDQGSNLAGQFFQASLLPYLGFLYFMSYPKNRTPNTANFGFQFLLLFVLSTVATGIVTKTVYSSSLANVDWLHGAAEMLLTCSNIYVGLGFRSAVANPLPEGSSPPAVNRLPAYVLAAAVVALAAAGPSIGLNAHDPFLLGLGNLPPEALQGVTLLPEPENALSLPTWLVHYSSVFEWLFAMSMVWQYAETTGNPRWRGLTWGMLPLHASGVAACTYHFFFNAPDLAFLVTLQAFLTLLGNTTVAIAACRIALSNGWGLKDLIPPPLRGEDADADSNAAQAPAMKGKSVQPLPLLIVEIALITAVASYGTKYGELLVNLPFEANPFLAAAMCAGIPALVANSYASGDRKEAEKA
uniref:Ycf49-like protein n=1 Tax=Chrysotila carterae TaxID=13221 RepID=A0A7S4BDR5_CHRCT